MVLTKAQAKSLAILDVARSLGMEMKRKSHREYYWAEHDSFKIDTLKNTWHWYSRTGKYGDPINLVQEIKNVSYKEAMHYLDTGEFSEVDIKALEAKSEPFKYTLEKYEHLDFELAKSYLKDERGLSDETIDFFLSQGSMAEATRKKGDYLEPVIVFKYKDHTGFLAGASLQGIIENRVQHPERGRLKQIMKNSDGLLGFSVDVGTPNRLVFAESPIDLMSYYELHEDTLQNVRLVAMDGVKEGIISRRFMELYAEMNGKEYKADKTSSKALEAVVRTTDFFKEGNHQNMITLAVDNDPAGHNFITNFLKKEIPVQIDIPPILYRNQDKADWNDYLSRPVTPGTNLSHIYSFDGEEYHYQGYYPEELAALKQKELATDGVKVLISKETLTKEKLEHLFDNLPISTEKKVQEVQEADAEYHVSKPQELAEPEEKKLDNSRLGQARRKLDRLNNEFSEATDAVYRLSAMTNGQPMNDKRDGASYFKRLDLLENRVFDKLHEIKDQEERVERLEQQQYFKEQGLNRQGTGLEMSVQNIPRIREELEKAKRGESFYTNQTLKRYREELTRLEGISEQMAKTAIQPATQALIDEGIVNQWAKQPNLYFVKGLRRVALVLTDEGRFEQSPKYRPNTDEEKELVKSLLDRQSIKEKGISDELNESLAIEQANHPEIVQTTRVAESIYPGYLVLLLQEENQERSVYLGKAEKFEAGHYDNSDQSLIYLFSGKGKELRDGYFLLWKGEPRLSREEYLKAYGSEGEKVYQRFDAIVQMLENDYHLRMPEQQKAPEENQEQLTEPQLQVVFDFTENQKLSRQYSSGDIIPYKDFISKLYEENEWQMIGFKLGYDKTYFALADEKGNRLTNNFRYDIGTENQALSEQLAQNLPTPYLELAQKADHDYHAQVSYETFKADLKGFKEAVQSQIQAGVLSITLSDEAYFYTLVNYTGWSHPMQQLKPEALEKLKEHRPFFESINDTNIERFKEKGTPEQNQMYELLKGIQKELGRSNTSTVFSEEVAISAYNLNRRLNSLTAENWGQSYSDPLGNLGQDTWKILSYPANEIETYNHDYDFQLVSYHLMEYLNGKTGTVEISPETYETILKQLREEAVIIMPEVSEEATISIEKSSKQNKKVVTESQNGGLQMETSAQQYIKSISGASGYYDNISREEAYEIEKALFHPVLKGSTDAIEYLMSWSVDSQELRRLIEHFKDESELPITLTQVQYGLTDIRETTRQELSQSDNNKEESLENQAKNVLKDIELVELNDKGEYVDTIALLKPASYQEKSQIVDYVRENHPDKYIRVDSADIDELNFYVRDGKVSSNKLDDSNQKAPEEIQERKKVETNLGDFPEESQVAAPLPEANESRPLNDLSPSQTRSQPLLHFSINGDRKSIHKDNYHPVSDKDLRKLNRYTPHLQNAAAWYLENIADSQVTYFYQEGANTNSVTISYNKESFMHLTGIFPYKEGQTAEQTLSDFAAGNGQFDNILIANRGAAFDKLKVLPELPVIVDSESFYFGDLSDVEKFHTLNLDKAIRSSDQDVLLAFRTVDGATFPASLMRLRQGLNLQLDQSNQEKIILGIYRERNGKIEQLSINEDYIKDGGRELQSIMENGLFEEDISKEEPPFPNRSDYDSYLDYLDAVIEYKQEEGRRNGIFVDPNESLVDAARRLGIKLKDDLVDKEESSKIDSGKTLQSADEKIRQRNRKDEMDRDLDGLPDRVEEASTTLLDSPDSDGDGISDYDELTQGTDPNNFNSNIYRTAEKELNDAEKQTEMIEVQEEVEEKKTKSKNNFAKVNSSNKQKETSEKVEEVSSKMVSELIVADDIVGLNQHLKEGVKQYLNSEHYKHYLDKMSQLNNYSSRNIQLILAQNPNAKYVTSLNKWNKEFGRYINKGEKALKIIAPNIHLKKDSEGNPMLDKEGKPVTYMTFQVKSVFDVSQTKGKELPKALQPVKENLSDLDYANLYRSLKTIADNNHVQVRFEQLENGRRGRYNPKNNEIVIHKDMGKAQIIKTFLHETAHSELHHSHHQQTENLTYSNAELQAESVAYVVASYYGMDTAEHSFGYLAKWTDDKKALSDLETQLDIVQQEAKSLIQRMDKELEKLKVIQVKQDKNRFADKLSHYQSKTEKSIQERQTKEEKDSKKLKGISK